jgi:uncharacterized membrane protein YphA (DoxX/SURF4 family)
VSIQRFNDAVQKAIDLVGLGQGLFAIATAGLAIWSLTYGDFAWGAQSSFARIPWRETWVYASALIILAASAGLCFPRTALASVLTIGAYQTVGAAVSVPQILSNPLSLGTWYPFCEALTALVGASVLYAMLRQKTRGPGMLIASERAMRTAQVLFGFTCVFYGSSHFVYADYTAGMVPTWLPTRLAFAYFTGLGHVAAGIAIVFGVLPRLAAVLEAIMMSLFGLLVWAPSFFAQPRPDWATPPEHQWSELAVNLVLAASAWIVAISLGSRSATNVRLAEI